ncbi:hypothetical protein [Planctomicrobium sp. SH527]|uniref:hypothetical protein n=1 Tax=Planctomicrobium sp. SH527 TaxID=3448123 RepID=UPI003F5C1FA8
MHEPMKTALADQKTAIRTLNRINHPINKAVTKVNRQMEDPEATTKTEVTSARTDLNLFKKA